MNENLKRAMETVKTINDISDRLVAMTALLGGTCPPDTSNAASLQAISLLTLPDIALSLASIADSLEAMRKEE